MPQKNKYYKTKQTKKNIKTQQTKKTKHTKKSMLRTEALETKSMVQKQM